MMAELSNMFAPRVDTNINQPSFNHSHLDQLIENTIRVGVLNDMTNDNCGKILQKYFSSASSSLKYENQPDKIDKAIGVHMYLSTLKRRNGDGGAKKRKKCGCDNQKSHDDTVSALVIMAVEGDAYNEATSKEKKLHFAGRYYSLRSTNDEVEYTHCSNKNLGLTARRYRFVLPKHESPGKDITSTSNLPPPPPSLEPAATKSNKLEDKEAEKFKTALYEGLKDISPALRLDYLNSLYEEVSHQQTKKARHDLDDQLDELFSNSSNGTQNDSDDDSEEFLATIGGVLENTGFSENRFDDNNLDVDTGVRGNEVCTNDFSMVFDNQYGVGLDTSSQSSMGTITTDEESDDVVTTDNELSEEEGAYFEL